MRIRIHRGAHEIGGNCIEIAAACGDRVVLDVGRPLSAGWDDEVPLPAAGGLDGRDPSVRGVIISHPHLDHYGLVGGIAPEVPIYMGREASRLVAAASFFSNASALIDPAGFLADRVPFELGPFVITPFLNDHSAFDAYSLLLEADGRRVFYTGDLRAHGRKAALFERLVAHPPTGIDALMMEGTHVRADADHDDVVFDTESELEDQLVELCRRTAGAVVVCGSVQNLDRLVTVFRGARRAQRQTVIDLYGATVAASTRPSIPQPGFEGLRVYVPNRQRVRVKQSKEFWRTKQVAPVRVFPEELAADPGRFVFHVPSSTLRELIAAGVLGPDGVAVWSLWDGYLQDRSGAALRSMLSDRGIDLVRLHTSGHASVTDLKRLVVALDPATVVPIHSEATGRFEQLFANVEQHRDGEWWEV